MLPGEPVLTVFFYSSLAAVVAALGALPFGFAARLHSAWVGAAYALASGLMLGSGYLLITHGLKTAPLLALLGASAGVAYTFWTQSYAGTGELDTRPDHEVRPEEGYKAILQNTLHSASEGVAIGAAMAVDLRFGIFLALALALHNVGEGMALTELLGRQGMRPRESAGLCVFTNVSQPLLAIVTFAMMPALGRFEPVVLGFAAGALLHLVLTELVPASYERAAKPLVAVLMSTATAAVVFLETILVSGGGLP